MSIYNESLSEGRRDVAVDLCAPYPQHCLRSPKLRILPSALRLYCAPNLASMKGWAAQTFDMDLT